MKQLLMTICSVFLMFDLSGQALKQGTYINESGLYYVNLNMIDSDNIITEVNGIRGHYRKNVAGIFEAQSESGRMYFLRVISESQFASRSERDAKEQVYRFQTATSVNRDYVECTISKQYIEKMASDQGNAQLWAFCAQAAALKCASLEGGAQEQQLKPLVEAMKSLMNNSSSCPCEDAIAETIWSKF